MIDKKYFLLIIPFIAVALFAIARPTLLKNKLLASVFFAESTSTENLKKDFNNQTEKIKIVVVPGHDKDSYGTEFKGVKEAEINLELAKYLTDFLKQEERFDVTLIRDGNGYNSTFLGYINAQESEIWKFVREHRSMMNQLITEGQVETKKDVPHVRASDSTALKLYGINKWSNDIGADIVIHIHFNDYARRNLNYTGDYNGFSIYVPESQYSNSQASYDLAKEISKSLSQFFGYSNFEKEQKDYGIIEDQELIAIGSYNTLDAAGVLVEYGYIYEPQFTNPNTRSTILKEMAYQTYQGVESFFKNTSIAKTHTLPYEWTKDLWKGLKYNKDVLALQIQLAKLGFYPPQDSNLNDCPISGIFGSCTLKSVKEFQENSNIQPTSGYVGKITRTKLNSTKTD